MANTDTDVAIWKKHVAAWRGSGRTVVEFCAERGLAVSVLRYRIRREAAAPSPIRLARVKRVASPAAAAIGPSPAVVIEVGPARVRVERGVDVGTLTMVMAALGVGR